MPAPPWAEQVGLSDQVVGHHVQPEHRFHPGSTQALPVLHEAVPQVAEERPGAVRLAEQPGLAVQAGTVALIGEQQAAEVALGSLCLLVCCPAGSPAATGWRRIVVTPVDPLQRAVEGPGPQQDAIHREVLAAQQRPDVQRGQQEFEELRHQHLVEQRGVVHPLVLLRRSLRRDRGVATVGVQQAEVGIEPIKGPDPPAAAPAEANGLWGSGPRW